jgi:hypothetical protein
VTKRDASTRDPLGLSVGTANLVAVTGNGAPTVRRSVLTVFGDRAPEVGVPTDRGQGHSRGWVFAGFVERVADPVPLVAPDGSSHKGERLLADALAALIRTVRPGPPQDSLTVSVPAHWGARPVEVLRHQLRNDPAFGGPPTLVSDAHAALTALQAGPGLPTRGIVALCDFGATGTSITLADVAAGFRSVGETVRYDDFSGDQIDQAVLRHVMTDLQIDPSNTSAVVALSALREQCRQAKERLSDQTATALTGPLPQAQSSVRLTRAELEALLAEPLDGFLAALDDTLYRNNIGRSALAAVATVGGGARIPLVTLRLSEALRLPVITTPHAPFLAAMGAAVIAGRGLDDHSATQLARVAPATAVAAFAASTAGAGVAAAEGLSPSLRSPLPTTGPQQALAWSQDPTTGDANEYGDPGDYAVDGVDGARPQVRFHHDAGDAPAPPPPPWYRRPAVIFGAAASAAFIAIGGLVVSLQTGALGVGTTPAGSVGSNVPSAPPAAVRAPANPAPQATVAPAAPAAPQQGEPVVAPQAPPLAGYQSPPLYQTPAPVYQGAPPAPAPQLPVVPLVPTAPAPEPAAPAPAAPPMPNPGDILQPFMPGANGNPATSSGPTDPNAGGSAPNSGGSSTPSGGSGTPSSSGSGTPGGGSSGAPRGGSSGTPSGGSGTPSGTGSGTPSGSGAGTPGGGSGTPSGGSGTPSGGSGTPSGGSGTPSGGSGTPSGGSGTPSGGSGTPSGSGSGAPSGSGSGTPSGGGSHAAGGGSGTPGGSSSSSGSGSSAPSKGKTPPCATQTAQGCAAN